MRGLAVSRAVSAGLMAWLLACSGQQEGAATKVSDADMADSTGASEDSVDAAAAQDAPVDAPQAKPGAVRSACDPCESSAQCWDPGSVCAGMGKPFGAAGFFCQLPCSPQHPCPAGSVCDGTSTVEGKFVSACRPLSNFCGCSAKARKQAWTTPCFLAGFDASGALFGKCAGQWACDANGARCDAKQPTVEVCDGLDNDCDGLTDEGADCDDGDLCTTGEACVAGSCTKGKDQCECRHDSDCKVADACVQVGRCDKLALPYKCALTEVKVSCPPGQTAACKVLACEPSSGTCKPVAAKQGQACDADGDPCTEADACDQGQCKPGPTKPCDDANPCTFDVCKAAGGVSSCSHIAQTGACEDGNLCTKADSCAGGKCLAGVASSCDDGNACTADKCDAGSGKCIFSPTSAAHSCDDGDACTTADACSAGTCAGVVKINCDDGLICTKDSCVPTSGCQHKPVPGGCDDGNPCTADDTCAGGKCAAGKLVCGCQQNSDCVVEQAKNKCLGQLVCNKAKAPFACVPIPNTAPVCQQDNNPCTVAICDAKTGACKATAALKGTLCDDGDSCSAADICVAGTCSGATVVSCDDANPCTVDSCDKTANAVSAACAHKPVSSACDDGNACTATGQCAAGVCQPGAAKACHDDNSCTTDRCDLKTGTCVFDAKGSEGLVCTSGVGACGPASCKGGLCKALADAPCDDGSPCTDDTCVLGKGCDHAPNKAPCDDGNVCTDKDTCTAGACKPGAPRDCNDGNSCTLDKCQPSQLVQLGCVHKAAAGAVCDDGDLCTDADHCEGTKCSATPKDCGDDEECTLDTCKKGVCAHNKTAKNGKKCKVHKWCWGHGTCAVGTCLQKAGTCPDKKWQQMWPIQFQPKLRAATTLFDPVGVHVVRLQVDETAWSAYLTDVLNVKKNKAKTYRKAQIEFDGVIYKDVGIRPFGYGSQFYNPSKPNIRMNFDFYDDDAVGPYKRRNIRLKASGQDRTFLRQPLSQSLVQQAGGHAPRWSWARVFVNGEAFGLYQLFEHVDKRFFSANFGNNDGNDYEPSPICRGFNCPSSGCDKLSKYYKKDPGDGAEINLLAKIVAQSPDATWVAEASKVVDWQPLLAQYAVEAILSDFDSLAAAGNNYEVYINEQTKKMQFIPAGMDLNYGRSGGWYDIYQPWGKPNGWCKGRKDHLYLRVIKTPALRKNLDAIFKKLQCGAFSKEAQLQFFDKMRLMLADDLYNDPKGVASKAVIDKWYADIEGYVVKRNDYLTKKLGPCP